MTPQGMEALYRHAKSVRRLVDRDIARRIAEYGGLPTTDKTVNRWLKGETIPAEQLPHFLRAIGLKVIDSDSIATTKDDLHPLVKASRRYTRLLDLMLEHGVDPNEVEDMILYYARRDND